MKNQYNDAIYPGVIVLADPKYPDQNESKVRPLLVISSNEFHFSTQYAVCLGITTNSKPDPYLIQLPRTEIQDGHLMYDSQVMCNRVTTLLQSDLHEIAKVTPHIYNKILEKIKCNVIKWILLGGKK